MNYEEGINWLAQRVAQGNVAVFSGAGLSTESGLQDFRSRTGLWAEADPMEMCSIDTVLNNYENFCSFYKARLYVPESIKPNVGHEIIARWEQKGLLTGVITQNIDRLHQRAGSKNVAELHGSMIPVRCQSCGKQYNTDEEFLNGKRCECGGKLRPGIVLFGEMLPNEALTLADRWSTRCDTFIVFGSSLTVSPANYFPRQAKQCGAKLVIINRDETAMDYLADLVVHEGIGDYLTKVDNKIKEFADK